VNDDDAIARIRQADQDALRAQYAFAAGKFAEYFQQECDSAIQRIQAEYERLTEQSAKS